MTGDGSGIGLATARLLARRGAHVAVLDLEPGADFAALRADVTDDESVIQVIAALAVAGHKKVDNGDDPKITEVRTGPWCSR